MEKSALMNSLSYFAARKSESGTKTCSEGFVRSPAFITDYRHNTSQKWRVFQKLTKKLDWWNCGIDKAFKKNIKMGISNS